MFKSCFNLEKAQNNDLDLESKRCHLTCEGFHWGPNG